MKSANKVIDIYASQGVYRHKNLQMEYAHFLFFNHVFTLL